MKALLKDSHRVLLGSFTFCCITLGRKVSPQVKDSWGERRWGGMRGDGIPKKPKHEPCRKFFQAPLWRCHTSRLSYKGIFCPSLSFSQCPYFFFLCSYFPSLFLQALQLIFIVCQILLSQGSISHSFFPRVFVSLLYLLTLLLPLSTRPSLHVGLFLPASPVSLVFFTPDHFWRLFSVSSL